MSSYAKKDGTVNWPEALWDAWGIAAGVGIATMFFILFMGGVGLESNKLVAFGEMSVGLMVTGYGLVRFSRKCNDSFRRPKP